MKSIIFVSLLVAAIAIPLAEAQILPFPPPINITGRVFCSVNASVPGTTLTPFPNATVGLRCTGPLGTIAVGPLATTTASGTFEILLNNIILNTLTSLLTGNCTVVVTTPLVNCNVTLGLQPGPLSSPLQLLPGFPTIPGVGVPAIPVPQQFIALVIQLLRTISSLQLGANEFAVLSL